MLSSISRAAAPEAISVHPPIPIRPVAIVESIPAVENASTEAEEIVPIAALELANLDLVDFNPPASEVPASIVEIQPSANSRSQLGRSKSRSKSAERE